MVLYTWKPDGTICIPHVFHMVLLPGAFDFLIFGEIRDLGGRGSIYATVAIKIGGKP